MSPEVSGNSLLAMLLLCALLNGCAMPDTLAPTKTKPVVGEQTAPLTQPAAPETTAAALLPLSLPKIAQLLNAGNTDSHSVRQGWREIDRQLAQHPPLPAVRIHVALDAMITDADVRLQNHRRLWRLLQQLPDSSLNFVRAPPPDPFSGWIELVLIMRGSTQLASSYRSLDNWWLRYPDHAAKQTLVQRAPPKSTRAQSHDDGALTGSVFTPDALTANSLLGHRSRPQRVGLLLPLSGRYEQHASAIRDGFLAAWFADPEESKPYQIHIYDTTTAGATAAYQQVLVAGHQMVIGPLLKDDIATLLCSTRRVIPVLALNRLSAPLSGTASLPGCEPEPVSAAALYQFALAPEDEAVSAAQRMFYDGNNNALAFAPEGRWGQRVMQAFIAEFERLGGLVAESIYYPPDAAAVAPLVAAGLHLDASKKRLQEMETALRQTLYHRPYRRQDIDAIFMLGSAPAARQLRPLFDFYRAHELPIYATSRVYAETTNRGRNNDLNHVQFGDMPWVLAATEQARHLQAALAQAWPQASTDDMRLHAFGADAYALIAFLHSRDRVSDTAQRLAGHSGELSVSGSGHIHRRLLWARFVNGTPQLSNVEAAAKSVAATPLATQ